MVLFGEPAALRERGLQPSEERGVRGSLADRDRRRVLPGALAPSLRGEDDPRAVVGLWRGSVQDPEWLWVSRPRGAVGACGRVPALSSRRMAHHRALGHRLSASERQVRPHGTAHLGEVGACCNVEKRKSTPGCGFPQPLA